MERSARHAALVAFYVIVCGIMVAPICNLAHLATASHAGDSRLIIWTLAWDNHAWLDRAPSFFDANIFYPAKEALAYSEHLVGISLLLHPWIAPALLKFAITGTLTCIATWLIADPLVRIPGVRRVV